MVNISIGLEGFYRLQTMSSLTSSATQNRIHHKVSPPFAFFYRKWAAAPHSLFVIGRFAWNWRRRLFSALGSKSFESNRYSAIDFCFCYARWLHVWCSAINRIGVNNRREEVEDLLRPCLLGWMESPDRLHRSLGEFFPIQGHCKCCSRKF